MGSFDPQVSRPDLGEGENRHGTHFREGSRSVTLPYDKTISTTVLTDNTVAYVALSRARSMDGLQILNFNYAKFVQSSALSSL